MTESKHFHPDEYAVTLVTDAKAKWQRYEAMLMEAEGDGSLIGRYYLIAKSGCTDVLILATALRDVLDEYERLKKVEANYTDCLYRTDRPCLSVLDGLKTLRNDPTTESQTFQP